MSLIIVLIFCVLALIWSYKKIFVNPKGSPPGLPKLPIFGSYLFLLAANYSHLHKATFFWSKFFKSNIFKMWLGDFYCFVVNDSEAIKEILHNSDFDGRPDILLARLRDPNMERRGIFFTDGPEWKEQRRFVLRHLRDYGFGRRSEDFEQVINEEIRDMLDIMKNGPKYPHEKEYSKSEGHLFLTPYIFMPFTTNCFLHVMCNMRIPRADQEQLLRLAKYTTIFQRLGDIYGRLMGIITWSVHIFPDLTKYRELRESSMEIHGFFDKIVKQHLKTYDENFQRNFIDLYIKEMSLQGKESSFSVEQFTLSLVDFAFPAITAIGFQITLFLQHAILSPNVVKRMQDEIDNVVGCGRLPCLDDRKNLHYCEASVREILRIETLVATDVAHVAMVDTKLAGYNVPKGTVLFPTLTAFHDDEKIWVDARNFRPERFLDDHGRLCLKKDFSLPFGAGKRLCAGETFARNLLFLMITALIQQFDLVLDEKWPLPVPEKNGCGIVINAPDFWLKVKSR